MQNKVTSLFGGSEPESTASRRARVIAVTSGKGGVGKTNVATNLAITLARQGKRVCIFDADTSLANINILLGISPALTLEHFLNEQNSIDDILMEGPRGIRIVPGASGIAEFADLDRHRQQMLLNGLQRLESQFDYLLIDTAAGISNQVIQFVQVAEQAILVLSPDPTSLTDAFALTRVLKRNNYPGQLHALVNMAESVESARKVFQRFAQAVEKYLHITVQWFGHVLADRAVVSAVRLQHPVVLMQPDAPASQCFEQLAAQIEHICLQQPGRGITEYLRGIEPGQDALDLASAAIDLIRRAQPSEASVAATPQQALIDAIQRDNKTSEELAATIKPVIDAYVARFHALPLDMRETMYRHLELADFPDFEIRNQVMVLEQLFEKRHGRPLIDKEDSLFRLINQVRHSESEYADALARIQLGFERQYQPGPRAALQGLIARLRRPEAMADDFVDCIETLRHLYRERFEQDYAVPDLALRRQVAALLKEVMERETSRQDALAMLSSEIELSGLHLDKLQAIMDTLDEGGSSAV